MSRAKRVFIFSSFLLFVLAGSAFLTIEMSFREQVYVDKIEDPPQVWIHRGYSKKFPENSLEAYRSAFDNGARGIEVDLYFDTELSRFVVSYLAKPYKRHNGNLLFLEDVFLELKNRGYYWLDFKNLSYSNYKEARSKLLNLIGKYELLEHVFVESPRAYPLSYFSKAKISTLFLMNIRRGFLTRPLSMLHAKASIALFQFNGISLAYEGVDKELLETFAHLPLFVWTINDPRVVQECQHNPSVKVILSDELL